MIKFEDYRKDKEFKIDSLSYNELFESLKYGISKAICEFEKVEQFNSLKLKEDSCSINFKYGKDKDMYPSITLEVLFDAEKFIASYTVVFNPFKIEIHNIYDGKVHIETGEELTQALMGMMNEKFPNSDYVEKRKKYFKNAELLERKREELLFF